MPRISGSTRTAATVLAIGIGATAVLLAVGAAVGWLPSHLPAAGPGPSSGGSGPSVVVNLTIGANPVNGLDQVSPANFSVPQYGRVTFHITSYDTGVNPTSSMWARVMGTISGTESVQAGSSAASAVAWLSPAAVSHTFTILPGGWNYNNPMMNGSWGGGCGTNGSGMGGMGGCGSNGSGMGGMGGSGGMGGYGMGGFGMGYPEFGGWGMSGVSMMVNLPIPAAVDNSTPVVVTATVIFGAAGAYHWLCEAPCDAVAMATPGYMRGTVSVS